MLTSFSLSLGVLLCYLNVICRSASSVPGYILITLPLCSDSFLDYQFLILKFVRHAKQLRSPHLVASVTVQETCFRQMEIEEAVSRKEKKIVTLLEVHVSSDLHSRPTTCEVLHSPSNRATDWTVRIPISADLVPIF